MCSARGFLVGELGTLEHDKHVHMDVFVVFEGKLRGSEGSTNTENTPYGVFSVLVVFEGIGGGQVRKREKHKKCAHMGAFLRVFRVSGESGSGWASARGTDGN